MNLTSILTAIRGSKKRDDLSKIMNAAEARDSKLSSIEGAKERARLWAKFLKQGIKVGDMVFIHTGPKIDRGARKEIELPNMPEFMGSTHKSLWGKPITVKKIKTRQKEIVVRVPDSPSKDYKLSACNIDKFKLSLTPTTAALAHGLHARSTISGKFDMYYGITPSPLPFITTFGPTRKKK